MCGATAPNPMNCADSEGLSPRVWGNRPTLNSKAFNSGPIPTCVGQPCRRAGIPRQDEAYPHVCGATSPSKSSFNCVSGLSPRVWGNPAKIPAELGNLGPIPTCVGQPPVSGLCCSLNGAYPHVCGATTIS